MCSISARRFVSGSLVVAAALACAMPASAEENNRLFGFLPNYTTVEERPSEAASSDVPPLTVKHAFKLADLSSFDPIVFPFVAFKTALGPRASDSNFAHHYATAFADNALGNFMTTAILPSVTKQDPRYFRFRRIGYAASRSVVTRTQSGGETFNFSRVGGNLAAAGLSNLYYGPLASNTAGTMSRWGTMMMWNTISNEMKEFWPDLRAKLHKQ